MTRIVVVAKNGGDLLQDTQASDVVLNQASVVQVGVTKEHVESILREGNSVVITLKDGEKIVIENFFNDANNADNSLVFPEQDKGFALVEFDAAGKGVNYAGLESVEPLIYSDGNAGLIPWLFPVVTAGGILWWAHRHDKGDGADTTSPTAKAVLTGVTEDTGVNPHDFITQDNTLVFNGKITGPLAADEKIQISLDGGKTWVDAVVDRGNGSWSYDNTKTPLADGTYTVQVRTIDASGNIGSVTEQKVVIDTQAPIEGSLSDLHLTDDVGPVVGEIKNGTQTDDTRPEFSGKATPEVEHVNIYDNGQLIGTATVKADGTWTFTPETPLSGGAHSLTATPVDQAGNEGKPTAPIGFNVVGDAPPAPTIQTVADDFGSVQGPIQKNGVTDDKTPTISGTAQPGSVVHVYVDGKEVGTATVSPDKTWSLELPDLGTDGPKNITAQAVDAAGQASPMTGEYPIILDTTAPAKPGTITAEDDVGPKVGDIKPGDTTDDTTPSLSGTGEPGDKVTIYDNGQPVGSTTVKPDGTWSYTPDAPLAEGPHKIEVSQTDPAGNESPKSDPLDFTVDSSAVQITISASDNQEPNVGPIAKGGLTNDNTPVLSGTTKAGQVVTIKDEAGKVVGSATADANGKWSVELPTQADGAHTYTASTTLPSGVVAEAKTDFTIDSTAPAAPSVDSVTDDVGAIQGPLKSGDSTDDTTPTLTGKAEPGNVVTVYDDGKPVGSVVADPSGNWSYTVPAPGLTEGEHAITATQTDPAGNTSAPTSPFDVVIDTTIPAASAVITGVTDDTGVNAHDYITNDNTLIINGNTTAPLATGDKVQVRIDGGQWADAKVNADGTWSYDNTANPFTDGNHVVEARVIDAAGNYTPLVKQDITIDTLAPIDSPTSIDSVMDDVGPVQGPITNSVDSKTDDTRPDVSGKAPVDADHVNIYDNGKLLGTATVKADGTWTFTPETPLTAGPHSLTAVAEDKAGNVSPASAPWQFGVVGDAPPAPTIQTVADDFGSVQGPIQKNGVTDDKTPTISGTAQPGSVIHVYVDGKEVGTATVSPDKTWSLELPDLGTDGPKNITAQAVDAAGQTSPMTGEYPIILDTTAPEKPVVTAEDDVGPKVGDIKPGDTTDDTTPSLSGTGEPGDKVTIYDNGQPVGSTTVKPDGTWSYTPDAPLAEGPHKIEVSQTDPAGNEGPKSDPLDFTVDSSAVQITISASDNQEPNVGPIAKGGLTNDNTPVLSGTTKVGQVVTIKDEAGKVVGSATADANGEWSVELPTQADGAHTYTASTTLPSGVVAEAKTDFTIDSTAPAAPSVDSVTDDVGAIQGPLKSGDSTDDTTPTLTGKAEPGNVVTVYDDGKPVGSVVADPSGNWSYTVPAPGLTEGEHAITATQTDPAGNTSAPTSPFDVVIDTTIPAASAVITGVTDDTGVNAHDYITNDNTLIINGNTTAPLATGDKVQVRIDGGQWADAKVNADGTWSYDNTANPFTDGKHIVEARVIDAAGNYTPLVKQDITIDTLAPIDGSLTDLKLYDDVAPTVGNITNGDSTDDTTPTYSGKATPDVSVVNVYDNGQLIGSTAVNPDGTWSFTPTTPLTGKEHSFTASPVDNAGNEGKQTDALTFHLLVGAPAEPAILSVYDNAGDIIGPIQKDGATDDKTPTVSGTGEPGTVVHVYSNGVEVGSATVQADKSWSIELNDLGLDGVKNITAKAVNDAGVSSTETGTYPIVLDTTAPATPTFTATDDVAPKVGDIQSGDTTDDSTPTLKGQGEPGDKVTIYDNGQPIGSTTVKADGTWEYTPDKALVDGPHAITATQTDPAGNVSAPSSPLDFTVNTEQVNVQITGFEDNKAPVVGPVAKGGITNDDTPILNGTSKPNAVVTITDEAGKTVGSATTDANGKWTVELSSQADGTHTYTATAVLDNGTIATDTAKLTIDTTAPTALQIDQVVDDVGTVQGPLKSGDSTDDTTPTISGSKAEPGNLVTINVDGVAVGSAIADKDGHWSYTLPSPGLTEGEHAITATQTDPAGNVSAPSAPFDVVIDITPPTVTATITGITDDTGTVGDFITKDPTLIISGKVSDASQIQAGDKVQVSVDGSKWVDATLNADGTWSYDNTANPLTEGKHVVEARVVDKAGNAGAMTSQDVMIDTMPPNPLTDLDLKDDVGEVQGTIPNNGFTDDTRPEFTGKAPADVSVVNVYDNGQLIGSTTVNPDGTWSFTPDVSLTGGQHSLTATPIDVAGNEGPVTTPWVFDLLVTPPQSPVITNVEDNFGSVTGSIEKTVGVTDDKMPTVSGTGEIGTTIHVYSAGVVVGTAIVQPDGTWSVEVSDLGVDGVKDLTAQAVDKAGQLSPITGDFSFILDTAAPAKPTLAADDNVGKVQGPIHSGDVTDDTTPTFSGQGEPNSAVKIVDNGVEIGTVYVKPDGTWSFTPTTPLDNGSHLVTVTQTDPAGNKSIPSDPLSFEVDDRNVKITIEASDNEQPIIGPIMQGGYTNDDTPVLSGTTDAGAIVTITDKDGKAIVSVTADVNGIWTTELPHQADGAQAYTATAKLANGDTAEASIDFNIDTTKPVGLTIDSVMDDVGLIQGPLTSGDHSDDTTPTLAGTAEAFNWVNIYDNNQLVGSIQADGNGHWSYTIPTPGLADGLHALTATQTDKAGNVSDPTAPFDVVVDTIAPTDKAAVISISDDTGTLGDYVTSDNTLIINAKPIVPLDAGDKVQITLDGGVTWLDATNNGNGTWSYDNTGHVLADGTYKFGARVVDQAGNLGQQTLTEVVIDTVLEPAPTINMSNYQDNGDLATDFYSNDDQFTLNVTGEKGAQVVYQTLVDGQWTDLNTATIGADGTSSYDVDWSKLALDNVDRKFRAVVTDLAGNTATTYVGGTTEATAQNYKIDNVAAQGYFDYSNSTSNATGGLNTKGAFFQFSEAGERVFTIYKEDYRGAGHDENSQQIGADVIFKTDANGKLDVASALSYLDPFKNYVFKTVDAAGNVSVTDKYINVLTDPLKAYTSGNYVQWYYKPYSNLKEFSASAFMETDGVNFYNDAANLAGFATRFDGTGYWGETSVYLTLADGSKFSDGSSQKVTTVDENGYWEYSYNGFNPVNAGQLAGVRLVATHLQDLAETDTANYRVDLDIHAFKNGGNNGTAVYQVVGSYSNINAPIQYFKGQADTGAHDWKASIDHQVYTSTRDNDAFYSNGVATTVIYKVLDTVTAEMNSGGLYLGETGTTIGNGYGSQFDLDTFGNSNTNGWIDRNGDDRISINTTGKDFVDVNGDGIYDGLTGKGTDVGMHVTDMWNHFDASKDKIDLTDWMAQIKAETGTTVNSINISQFLQEHDVINAKTGAVSTVLSIDRDGAGSVYQSTQFLTLENSGHIDFNDLLKNNIIY